MIDQLLQHISARCHFDLWNTNAALLGSRSKIQREALPLKSRCAASNAVRSFQLTSLLSTLRSYWADAALAWHVQANTTASGLLS